MIESKVKLNDKQRPSVSWPLPTNGRRAFRLASGHDALAVRVSRKLKNDELLLTSFAGTRLKMELDRVPLWRTNHVSVKQLVEDFAHYPYLVSVGKRAFLSALHFGTH